VSRGNTNELVATFRIGSLLLGIDVHRVQEVVRDQALEPVPRAPLAIAGLLNLRGQILAVTDLRSRLGLPARGGTPGHDIAGPVTATHYIIRTGSELDSLLVDAEGDVILLAEVHREEIPDTVPPRIRPFVAGVYQLDHELLLVLDIDRVLDSGGVEEAEPRAGIGH
jgi:purine-binding chemotaxis protein CheW